MADDSSPSILDSILLAAKKLPGQTVGGGVDLMNLIAGGGANIIQALQGKEITRQVGEGLVPKPVGGSEHLNDLFGILNQSSGGVEDYTSAIMNGITPGGVVKGILGAAGVAAKTAVIVPALTRYSAADVSAASARLSAGEDATVVFHDTGIYRGPIDNKLRAVIPDGESTLNPIRIKDNTYIDLEGNPTGSVWINSADPKTYAAGNVNLSDILQHPELYDAFPALKDISIKTSILQNSGNAALYTSPAGSRIELGPMASIEDMHSAILHETQHIIQATSGFTKGASVESFLPSSKFTQAFKNVQATGLELKLGLAQKFGFSQEAIADFAINPSNAPRQLAHDPDFELYLKVRSAQSKGIDVQKQAFESYKNVAGEAEARAVQSSFEFRATAPLGAEFFPLSLYDRDPSKLTTPPNDALKAKP